MAFISVPIKNLDSTLEVPSYTREGDAGLDLKSTVDAVLQPFQRSLIPCGISVAIPQGYAGFIVPRSGLAAKHGISIVNAPGLIDSNYRGEIKAILVNLDPEESFEIKRGDRIAQLVIMETPLVKLMEVDELDSTNRGASGFGSSGVNAS